MNRHEFQLLAKQFRAGRLTLEEFTGRALAPAATKVDSPEVQEPQTADPPGGEWCLDLDRAGRCGFPEVVWGEGKSVETITGIAGRLRESGQPVLITRLSSGAGLALTGRFPDGTWCDQSRTFSIGSNPPLPGRVGVVTAGTSDLPVAREAVATLRWCGVEPLLIADIGIAGPQRLAARLDELRRQDCLVVVAGCEGALPGVVAGHVGCPVIAVPSSVGYGTGLGGVAALVSMLNSCAAHVAVVNIDAGFKGGYLAAMMLKMAQHRSGSAAESGLAGISRSV